MFSATIKRIDRIADEICIRSFAWSPVLFSVLAFGGIGWLIDWGAQQNEMTHVSTQIKDCKVLVFDTAQKLPSIDAQALFTICMNTNGFISKGNGWVRK